eukprot:3338490-Rhodomonas_salina.1
MCIRDSFYPLSLPPSSLEPKVWIHGGRGGREGSKYRSGRRGRGLKKTVSGGAGGPRRQRGNGVQDDRVGQRRERGGGAGGGG